MWWVKALQSLLQALRIGHELSYPGAWKNVQTVASLLTALIGILWALGFEIRLLPDDIFVIAGTIVALINAYLVIATSKKVGLPSESKISTNGISQNEIQQTELRKTSMGDDRNDHVLVAHPSDADILARRMREFVLSESESRQNSTESSTTGRAGTSDFPGWNDR